MSTRRITPSQAAAPDEALDDPFLSDCAARIRALRRRVVTDVIEIGRLLTECKDRLEHGQWLPWLEHEFRWSDRHARNFMHVYELSAKSENFSDLNLPVSSIYLLAAPSTPEPARTEVTERTSAGERLRHDEVREIIAGHSRNAVLAAATRLRAEELQARDDARKAEFATAAKGDVPSGLHVGDFRTLAPKVIPDNSVQLVFTDPPYDRDSVPLYGAIAAEAKRILVTGGILITYCGQVTVFDVQPLIAAHLRYLWLGGCGCVHCPPHNRIHKYGIINAVKPMLWFSKDYRGDVQTFVCDHVSGAREKDAHEWQQSLSEAEYYIERLTGRYGTVVDFCCGSGTTLVAAQRLGRKWIGFESDENCIPVIINRLAETPPDPKPEAPPEDAPATTVEAPRETEPAAPEAYDAAADFEGSLNACYLAVRERVAAGGPGWTPREPQPPATEPAAPDGADDPLAIPDFLLRRAPL